MTQCPGAVVFDLDGTLIDSAPDLLAGVNRLLAEEGRRSVSLAELRHMVGDGAAVLVRRAFEATGGLPAEVSPGALTARFLVFYQERVCADTVLFEGVVPALDALCAQGWRLAVCTNKPFKPAVEILRILKLDRYFGAVLGGDSIDQVKKPDPRHLLETMKALGMEGRPAIMVGDSANDVQAARAAGWPVVAVSFGYTRIPAAELGADRLIDRFDELPNAIAGLKC